jgi:peptide/nickel transport system substrate-binding protein
MVKYRRLTALAAGAALAVGLAACTGASSGGSGSTSGGSSSSSGASGFNAAITNVVNPSTKTGGTLKVAARRGDCDAWDPQRTYYGFCWTLQRLFTRSLMGFESVPNSTKVVPDMATGPGEHNADNTQWTYHLRDGVTWQDGTAITSKDIKYGIERLFATDTIFGGPNQYYLCVLSTCDKDGTPAYKGPYKDKGGLDTIQTPDDKTIVFKLNKSVGLWDYLMALPASAPVPQAKDTGARYTNNVWASGPFQFKSYTPKQSIVWVRNPNWKQDSDPIRKPLANEIDLKMFSNVDQADAATVAGQYDFEVDNGVGQTQQGKVIADPKLKANSDDVSGGYTFYFAVMQSVPPLNNIHCRQAVFYAMNKADLNKADGGSYGGDITGTMSATTVPGYDKSTNPYPSGADNTGDLTKAKSELAACGQPNGFPLKMAYQAGGGRATLEFSAVQQALSRVGIQVSGLQLDSSSYYSTGIGSPKNIVNQKIGIAWAGWAPDFPLSYGYWKSIVDGRTILPSGNSNYASLNDPKVNGLIDQSLKAPIDQQAGIEKQINDAVMANAVYLPYNDNKALFVRNPRVANMYMQKGTGSYYDIVNVGLK